MSIVAQTLADARTHGRKLDTYPGDAPARPRHSRLRCSARPPL